MAAPDLRIVRRPRGQPRPALTAASAPVGNPSATFKNSLAQGGRVGWQTRVWDLFYEVGELSYYVSWRSNSCSRCRIVASELDEFGLPTGSTGNTRVNEIAASIGGNHLGQSQLIKRSVECLTLPGETWIAVVYPPGSPSPDRWPGRWLALSRDEIHSDGGTNRSVKIALPEGGELYELNTATDTIFRVWNPDPRFANQATSPVRACIPALEGIVRTTATIENAAMSRLVGNGILFVPQEMSLPSTAAPVSADKPGSMSSALLGTSSAAELQDLLFMAMSQAVQDPKSMAAMSPIIAAVNAELIGKVQHIRFDNAITDTAIKTRNDDVMRLAIGLDVSPERLLGMGSSTSHWSAWAIGDSDVQLHVAPVMETLCQAFTDRIFRDRLVREGIADPEKYILWYDTGQLTADPDKSDDAQKAFELNSITGDAYREMLNLGDTGYDLTTMAGAQQWARDMVTKDPALLTSLQPLLGPVMEAIEFPEPVAIGSGRDSGADGDGQQEPATEDKAPGYDQGRRGRKSDVAVHQAIIEMHVARALEFAGKRRRSRADYDRLRDIPMHQTHRAMGPVTVDAVPDLIKGWDSALEADTLALVGLDIDEVRAEVRRQVRSVLTAELVNA